MAATHDKPAGAPAGTYKVHCATCALTLETDATLPRARYIAEKHTITYRHHVTIVDGAGRLINE